MANTIRQDFAQNIAFIRLLIDFQLVQKGMVTGDLERAACEMLIQKLIVEYDCKIQLFLSDRHRGIRYFFLTKHPE